MKKLPHRVVNIFCVTSLVMSFAVFLVMEWQRNTLSPYRTFEVSGYVTHVTVSPNGQYLAATCAGSDRHGAYSEFEIVVWDIESQKVIYADPIPRSGLFAPEFSEDSTSLLFRNDVVTLSRHLDSLKLSVSGSDYAKGQRLTRSADGQYELWSRPSGITGIAEHCILNTRTRKQVEIAGNNSHVVWRRAKFTPDGRTLHGVDVTSGTAVFWDVRDGKPLPAPHWVADRRPHALRDVSIAQDGSKVATAWDDNNVSIHPMAKNKLQSGTAKSFRFPGGDIGWMDFVDDNRFLVIRGYDRRTCSAGDDRCIRRGGMLEEQPFRYDWRQVVWDLETGASLAVGDSVRVSKQGFLIRDSKSLRDLRSGHERQLTNGFWERVIADDFVGGGRFVIGERERNGGRPEVDKTIYLWKVPSR